MKRPESAAIDKITFSVTLCPVFPGNLCYMGKAHKNHLKLLEGRNKMYKKQDKIKANH